MKKQSDTLMLRSGYQNFIDSVNNTKQWYFEENIEILN